MRCPECKTLNDPAAAACLSCGLILLKKTEATVPFQILAPEPVEPHRRAEDFAGRGRRSSDAGIDCQFCGGKIATNAIRCKHCSEIVNEEFYRERAHRTRQRVNYASWVAYLFGLGALLVFRPVGLLSIAAGLLLSIV
jgi:hypothetical protein